MSSNETIPKPIKHIRKESLERRDSDECSIAEEGEHVPLLPDENYDPNEKWYNGPLFVAGVRLAVLFMIFTSIVAGTFYWGVPKLEEADKGVLKLPRSFADLQALNHMFQKYKALYPLRILACGVVSYLFVQTFSLPGSMYISILFGAAYGMARGLLLSCLCESVGSVFCYTLSAILAPPLLALPFYRARVETWRTKIMGPPEKQVSWDGVFAFLIVLRVAPFPPHWVANFVAPHLGINVGLFWLSCFLGIAPVSVIHVTIGSSLDSMTSADDFHILSVRNVLGLCAVVVAVLIPVGLKRIFRKDLGDLDESEQIDSVLPVSPPPAVNYIQPIQIIDGRQVRYQAVDSGLVLAGPSQGDGNLDTGKINKGKGRAVEIIPRILEDDEEDVFSPISGVSIPKIGERDEKKLGKKDRWGHRGYGTLDTTPLSVSREENAAAWWAFQR
ncbi:hypothetical protein TREMEDRAFT_58251 [Tremella mesenterica DSM 1558]|uniref:uncharacterized protein n=1 Tax=Tremella mesenterica (strain ATCC 24925 / CBS 8224 / DSM 1558 / NBRC 9311 / NRRL Y-6157 / RJB 2259-6 / UBC 559-6) TaxID=578456 RepID=UPI0003F48D26|nr:uncharacterized protein TREMEDRAFT_58251 [Tremella mesenterica DSM 1558]EIW72098.1 hypothetical protein TREMEDRAFT_58251 [Tremella mesenterica DSM 1558]